MFHCKLEHKYSFKTGFFQISKRNQSERTRKEPLMGAIFARGTIMSNSPCFYYGKAKTSWGLKY